MPEHDERLHLPGGVPMSGHARLGVWLLCLLAACGGERRPGVDGGVNDDAGTRGLGMQGVRMRGTADGGGTDAGVLPPPRVLGALPARGESGGGTWSTVRGSGYLLGVASSTTEAEKRTYSRSAEFRAGLPQSSTTPCSSCARLPGPAGPASIILENPRGLAVCAGCFTWFEPLTLRTVSPESGPLAGGNTVALTGTGFTDQTQVLFGAFTSPRVTRVSSTELRAVVPRAPHGRQCGGARLRRRGRRRPAPGLSLRRGYCALQR